MGVSVDEVGAGLWLMVVSWWVMVGEHGAGDVWAYVVLSVVSIVRVLFLVVGV